MTIRNALPCDSAAVAAISCDAMGYFCTEELVRSRIENINENREVVFVAESDGEVMGFIHAEVYDLLYAERMVNILGLAVGSEFRRRGAGRMLMEAAENWAKEHGAEGIRLNSGGTRLEAHRFYRASGFSSEKQQLRFEKLF